MNRSVRILVVILCIALLGVSWLVAVTMQSDLERQTGLYNEAMELLEDGLYIRAYPLLEEAIDFNTEETFRIEEILKDVYLNLIDQSGFRRRYMDLLSRQMDRADAPPEVFMEAAMFHLSNRRLQDALAVLRDGIEKTGSEQLITLYEEERYAFRNIRTQLEYIMEGHNATFQIKNEGLWGVAGADGSILVPYRFDEISTFSGDRAFVMSDGEVFAVDRRGNRILKLHENVTEIGNFADNRLTLMIDGRWHRATSELEVGATYFDMIGMHSSGNAAAMQGGRWGVIDSSAQWIIPAEHGEVIMDELGRAYGQGAVFVRNGNAVTLLVDGERVGGTFEDARPFGEENFAAVKNNGLWGFINTSGELVISYQFEDARSFGQHLAAVQIGDYWGYINLLGDVVIEPEFLEAKSFNGGSAPVLTESGWQFIALIEYVGVAGGGLF
ncbi:MAG: WG repeat-containing protein [Oscillospiraceae bacterium]|nr:WG repeat-containing protein [Oscillospiraceae bacterium]